MFGLGNIEAVALESARFKRTAVVTMTGEEEDNIIRVRSSMGRASASSDIDIHRGLVATRSIIVFLDLKDVLFL